MKTITKTFGFSGLVLIGLFLVSCKKQTAVKPVVASSFTFVKATINGTLNNAAAGHQPMIYRQRFVISFNGEIYNFPELKKELEHLGSIFHTNSDTEVILAAFEQWNTQSFGRLSGMFAFALYDSHEKDLYLVRDTSGIKPLYYRVDSSSIEFASEIRAF